MRALTSSYAGRKERKRQFRQLWIARINAAARINGLSYSKFMYGLKLAEVDLNRKVLSDMAINDAEGFAKLAELAKEQACLICSEDKDIHKALEDNTKSCLPVLFVHIDRQMPTNNVEIGTYRTKLLIKTVFSPDK